jgi:hypothetical protein
MDEERVECFTLTNKLNRIVFEGRTVDKVRIMVTTIPVKLVATKDKVYYADQNPKNLIDRELFDLKTSANKAIPFFNTILSGRWHD